MNPLRFIAAIVLASLVTGSAHASVIRGTLRVPAAGAPQAMAHAPAYPGRASSLASVTMVAHGLPTDAVIYVEKVPAEADSALAHVATPMPKLSQKGQAFVPRVIAIAAGTKVDFPNMDPIYHNVFSLSPTRRFDLGKYPRGQSKQIVFSKPGLVNVYCDIHSNMEGFILVLPHHAFTRPRADGEYALPALPGGRYTLHVWHPDFGEIKQEVDLPAAEDAVVDLAF